MLALLSPAKAGLLQNVYQTSGEGFSSSLAVHMKAVIGAVLDMLAVPIGAVVGEPFPPLHLVHLQAAVLPNQDTFCKLRLLPSILHHVVCHSRKFCLGSIIVSWDVLEHNHLLCKPSFDKVFGILNLSVCRGGSRGNIFISNATISRLVGDVD